MNVQFRRTVKVKGNLSDEELVKLAARTAMKEAVKAAQESTPPSQSPWGRTNRRSLMCRIANVRFIVFRRWRGMYWWAIYPDGLDGPGSPPVGRSYHGTKGYRTEEEALAALIKAAGEHGYELHAPGGVMLPVLPPPRRPGRPPRTAK
jgi:hypothetical protein